MSFPVFTDPSQDDHLECITRDYLTGGNRCITLMSDLQPQLLFVSPYRLSHWKITTWILQISHISFLKADIFFFVLASSLGYFLLPPPTQATI